MNEGSWEECIENAASVKITPNKPKARSLLDTAMGRLSFLKGCPVAGSNANYIFEGYYSSAMEILHALVLLQGFKVNNHICLGYYIRDILGDNELFRLFDNCRFNRNSLLYYGKKMDLETAKSMIEASSRLIKKLKGLVEKKL